MPLDQSFIRRNQPIVTQENRNIIKSLAVA